MAQLPTTNSQLPKERTRGRLRVLFGSWKLAIGGFLLLSGIAAAQDLPSFDAASIKPAARPVGPFLPGSRPVCPLNGCGGPGTGSPERITFTFTSLKNLIRVAYNAWSPNQIEAPAWMESATFDVVANVPPGATRDQANLMLQKLLADRFQLKVHRSTKELPIYALAVAKNGPKLKVSVADPRQSPAGRSGAAGERNSSLTGGRWRAWPARWSLTWIVRSSI